MVELLQKALADATTLVENGYWVKIQTYRASIILDYGVIHDDGTLECTLSTKLYILEKNHEKV